MQYMQRLKSTQKFTRHLSALRRLYYGDIKLSRGRGPKNLQSKDRHDRAAAVQTGPVSRELARDSGQRKLTSSKPNPCASSRSVYLSGGLKPATETSRILVYPPLTEAGVFPTEIKTAASDFPMWQSFCSSYYIQVSSGVIRNSDKLPSVRALIIPLPGMSPQQLRSRKPHQSPGSPRPLRSSEPRRLLRQTDPSPQPSQALRSQPPLPLRSPAPFSAPRS